MHRIVVVTGANGGLGRFVTEAFLAAGDTVVGVSRSVAGADFAHTDFVALAADLTDPAGANGAVAEVVDRFGRIDVLVHVMGGFAGGQPVQGTDDATWRRMMDLNLNSAFYTFRAVVPHMRRASQGRIVAIGGRAALEPGANIAAYSASKAAMVALGRSLAAENNNHVITVNMLLPGTMDTPANRAADPRADFSKWVAPAKVAQLALWLASEEASEVTGAAIPVYGQGL